MLLNIYLYIILSGRHDVNEISFLNYMIDDNILDIIEFLF